MESIAAISAGMLLGLSIAAPPGPVNALIAVQAISSTKLNGFLVGLGALTADAIFLIASYYLGSLLFLGGQLKGLFFIISACLMAFLSYFTLKSTSKGDLLKSASRKKTRMPYFSGLAIGITNPFQISWWMSVGISLISSIGIMIIAGFFAGILIWITSFPLAMNLAGKRFSSLYRAVVISSGLLLAAFSAWFFYNAILIFTLGVAI
ncbi:MAG: LysE family transporter [Candidatus Methanomethylicia archaeon]|nr:LysE family transporter [Candidatus Methanomethylicia archaeon]